MELASALQAHYAWKAKLQAAAQSGGQLDAALIRKDGECELGQWLHGEGGRLYGKYPEFVTLLEKHKEFHFTTSVVADLVNRRQQSANPLHLEDLRHFDAASTAVGIAVMKLQRMIGGVS